MIMEFEKLLNYLTVTAVLTNCIEKLTSYVGQRKFLICEGNALVATLIQKAGLELGHIMLLLLSIIALILLRYITIVILPYLEGSPRLREIARTIPIATLIFIIAVTIYVATNNIYLIWEAT